MRGYPWRRARAAHTVTDACWRCSWLRSCRYEISESGRPARLEIFDSRGGLVASGSVGETSASATWDCAAMPAGMYFLRVRDDAGNHLATASFVKR
jgi:hypothetical protein